MYARFTHSWARFWEITKITSFWGNSWRFPAGKKLPASVENHFHSEAKGFVYLQYSLLQVQLNLQKKRHSSLMKTTPQGGCHETA